MFSRSNRSIFGRKYLTRAWDKILTITWRLALSYQLQAITPNFVTCNSRYLNQCWLMGNWNISENKIKMQKRNIFQKMHLNCLLLNFNHLVRFMALTNPRFSSSSNWITLQRRHNEHDGVSNHQPHHCLLNRLFRHRSKRISKLCVTGLCEGNSPVTGEFPAQRASNAENVSIWWRHHDKTFSIGSPVTSHGQDGVSHHRQLTYSG